MKPEDILPQGQSLTGRQLGPYQILSLLGAGGMGKVYRAKDTRLEREVAVKVLPENLTEDHDALARFKREAKAVAALSHPNILTLYDVGIEEGVSFAVMELLEGETLRARLAHSILPWRKAAEIGVAIAEGMAAAHAKGIIHRDLKPGNIFLTKDGQVKILDFGLARNKPAVSTETLGASPTVTDVTMPGRFIGTMGYMSPEQVCGQQAEAPSDIFAFGCVLYEMVTGRRAFAGQTASETIAAIMTEDPPAPGNEAPNELETVIEHCLEKRPEDRFQSARDLAFALRAILGRTRTLEAEPEQPIRGSRALWIGGALLVGVTALLWWQPWRGLQGPQQQRLISRFPGSHREASFSPDGSMITFSNDVGGIPQVWVKNLAQGDPIQITSGETPAHRPRWSPRNDEIVFSVGRGWSQSIWSVPPLGGNPRKVIEGGRNPNWSWDGSRLVYEKNDQVWTAKADGSDQQKLEGVSPVDLLLADRMPSYSPDGSMIAFFQNSKGPHGDIWIVPSSGGQARQLTFDDHFTDTPVWTPDGRFIVFSSLRSGSRTLWKIAVAGGAPEPVLQGAGEDTEPEISRDGRKLIYTNTRNSFVLTLWDPVTNQSRELKENRYDLVEPSFRPQGDKISFFEIDDVGDVQVSTIDTEGGNLTQITRGKGERNIHPRWSHDGLALYYYQARSTASFRKVPLSGGPSSEIASGWLWGSHYAAQIDPSGKRIAYTKRTERLLSAIIREIESGQETLFKLSFGYPRWSKDGKEILGVETSSSNSTIGDISICAVATGSCRKLTKGGFPRWSGDGSRIFFLRYGSSREDRELWSVSVKGGEEKRVGELRVHPIGPFYDVSPKGEIVYVRYNQGKHELWLSGPP